MTERCHCWEDLAQNDEMCECADCGRLVPSSEAVRDVEVMRATHLDPPQYGDLCWVCASNRAWRERRAAGR